jgi:hypothetical protein
MSKTQLSPQEIGAIIYALRFQIAHLKAVGNDPLVSDDDRADAKNDFGYLEGLEGRLESEMRSTLGLKPTDPI